MKDTSIYENINKIHRLNPYNGRYGHTRNPGFIHFFSGLFFEKKLLHKGSSIHPKLYYKTDIY